MQTLLALAVIQAEAPRYFQLFYAIIQIALAVILHAALAQIAAAQLAVALIQAAHAMTALGFTAVMARHAQKMEYAHAMQNLPAA